MSRTPKQSPLGVNVLSSFVQSTGLAINSGVTNYVGGSSSINSYTAGAIVGSSLAVEKVTTILSLAYNRLNADISVATFRSLLAMGSATLPALANGKPSTYTRTIYATKADPVTNTIVLTTTENLEPSSVVIFPVLMGNILPNTFYWVTEAVSPTRIRISATAFGPALSLTGWSGNVPIENFGLYQFGFLRLIALQAYDEFNYNSGLPKYDEFLSSFMTVAGYLDTVNSAVIPVAKSTTYLDGVYSNMDDLISADISGVSLATTVWGQDLIASGRAIDLSTIDKFGLPSNLLETIKKNRCVTDAMTLAALTNGFTAAEWETLLRNTSTATAEQERTLWNAYNLIVGTDLAEILTTLNCKTSGIESLADLLNPQKLFPSSYSTLTVPVYNVTQTQTNSKTYYPIYVNNAINPALYTDSMNNKIGSSVPPPSVVESSIENVPISAAVVTTAVAFNGALTTPEAAVGIIEAQNIARALDTDEREIQ